MNAKLKLIKKETLNEFLLRQGFSKTKGEPTQQDYEDYFRVVELLQRDDLPFTPSLPVIYEKRLSDVTTLYVEKKIVRMSTSRSLYDFYKIRRIKSFNSQEIKVYASDLYYTDMLQKVSQYFNFLEKGKRGFK